VFDFGADKLGPQPIRVLLRRTTSGAITSRRVGAILGIETRLTQANRFLYRWRTSLNVNHRAYLAYAA